MNYENFYGFVREPFSDIPDPKLFYSGPEHARALVKLLHVVKKGRALGILTGAVGCGKTTIARRILAELDKEDNFYPGLMILTHQDFGIEWFTKKIGELLGLRFNSNDRSEMVAEIIKKLYNIYRYGMKTVILIDEANNITNPEILEELRGLLNLELQGDRLLTMILSGMHEMLENIKDNRSLRQRISTIVDLPPLNLSSTKEYIKYRIEQTGVNEELFDEESLKLIYEFSKGVPRVINVICDNALLEGALLKKRVVEGSILNRVGEELLLKD
ncbi:AAA family ATPase [candidate division WOR-3 bacterium]|jgi:type II secretory pathway predicted ATPase ExeA|nr:AAA family ATPase [candidate division WOR-3 bacterium]